MTTDELKKAHQARPFEPFAVHLADGRKIEVPHPEFLAMRPGARTFSVALPDGTHAVVDLMLVTSITIGNGAKRRGRRSRR